MCGESQDQASQMWFSGWLFIQEHLLYLKQTASHGKDPPDHLQGLTGVRQEGQPAEGKSHQDSWSNSHQQEKPTWRGSHRQACVISERKKYSYTTNNAKKQAIPNKIGTFLWPQYLKNANVDMSLSSATSTGIPQTISTYCLQVLNLGFDPCVGECSESHASAESLQCRSSYLVSWNCGAAG